jgi:uncharacterized SAM-binding protein YcdF (DUF218 family)
MKKVSQKIATVMLWLMFAACGFVFLATFTNLDSLLVKPLIRDEAPQKADVIIVLGGGVNKDTRALPWGVEERVQKGVELYKDGYADKIIVTGGLIATNSYAESEVMAPYAIQLGVPAADVIQENKAKDTHTNAIYSKKIMDQNNWHTAIMVTSDFHTQRACHVFHKQNISVTCVAAYKNPAFKGNAFRNLIDFRAIARDYLATVYYKLKGYI